MSDDPVIDDAATLWAPGGREGMPLLVLLHGYGADEHDLFALAPHLPGGVAVASVAAPLLPPWPMPGRSWYAIDGLDGRRPEEVTAAARALLRWIDDAARTSSSIALLGFSQGAAVALQAMRLAPERFDAIVALSGYAAPGELPHDEALRDLRPRVFWGRGTADDVIPPALVARTAEWLPEHADLSGRVYRGLAHGISTDELADVHAFLASWLRDFDAPSDEPVDPSA
ncbi:alpha/beta hydrolase [Microbacterium sp. 179-I 3D4 NHS]|uniref:alpha/beta hydrolase n=1 Tax=Microbacterium sp. 179-I 3D4 NHS TaxID=3142381 RepID=UPI00399F78EA